MAGTVGPGCAERLAGGDSGAGGDVDDGTTTLPISPTLAGWWERALGRLGRIPKQE